MRLARAAHGAAAQCPPAKSARECVRRSCRDLASQPAAPPAAPAPRRDAGALRQRAKQLDAERARVSEHLERVEAQVAALPDRGSYLEACGALKKQQDLEVALSQQLQVTGGRGTGSGRAWRPAGCRTPASCLPARRPAAGGLMLWRNCPRRLPQAQRQQLERAEAAHQRAAARLREVQASTSDASGARLLELLQEEVQALRQQVGEKGPKELERRQKRLAALREALNNGVNTEVGRCRQGGWQLRRPLEQAHGAAAPAPQPAQPLPSAPRPRPAPVWSGGQLMQRTVRGPRPPVQVDLQRLSSQASQLQAAISGLQEARAAREKAQQGDRAYLQVGALPVLAPISPGPAALVGRLACCRGQSQRRPTYPATAAALPMGCLRCRCVCAAGAPGAADGGRGAAQAPGAVSQAGAAAGGAAAALGAARPPACKPAWAGTCPQQLRPQQPGCAINMSPRAAPRPRRRS